MVKTPTLAFSTFVILGKQNPKLRIKVNHHLNHAARTRNVKPMEKKEYASDTKINEESRKVFASEKGKLAICMMIAKILVANVATGFVVMKSISMKSRTLNASVMMDVRTYLLVTCAVWIFQRPVMVGILQMQIGKRSAACLPTDIQ